jgi:hypothetical protein
MNNELRQKYHSMAIQKIKTIPFVLFLASGIFVESVTSGICFCGRCYPDSIQDKTDMQINSNFCKSVFGSICKNCRLKNRNSIKAVHFYKQNLNVKIFHMFLSFDLRDFLSSGTYVWDAASEVIRPFQNLPIYLQNLSFRC